MKELMMSKTIKFKAVDEYGFETQIKPFPASQILPKWWKDMTPYLVSEDNVDGKKIIVRNNQSNTTFKKCTPMLDALTGGYIISLWADVQISIKDGIPDITWRTERPVFTAHGANAHMIDPPSGYTNFVAKYQNTWIPITPPGYSVLVTSPFGYKNLPFHAVPGIVDSDKSVLELVNPVWIKEGFEGIVEKGTPIAQVIPFKRDSWNSEFDFYKKDEHKFLHEKTFSANIVNHYVRNHWSKKTFK